MKMHLVMGPSLAKRRGGSTDADNPPWTQEELRRAATGRAIRRLRAGLNLTPEEFAERYGFDADELDAWEKGRVLPGDEVLERLDNISADPPPTAKPFRP